MKTFFTSDTHFGHANIIRYSIRPWLKPGDVNSEGEWNSKELAQHRAKEMNRDLIKNWNSTVTDSDNVYHLGDFLFGSGEEAIEILHELHFSMFFFIWGNHDSAMEQVQLRFQRDNSGLAKRVKFLGEQKEVKVEGQRIVLNHYAMRVWDKSHHGSWHLYGHSHGSLPDDPHSRSFDVGVDCHNYRPISFEEVSVIMNKKLWKPLDHHGERKEGGGLGLSKEEYARLERKRLFEQLREEFRSIES